MIEASQGISLTLLCRRHHADRRLKGKTPTTSRHSKHCNNRKGLQLNINKTETMVITKSADIPTSNIIIQNKALKQAQSFVYLGSTITPDGRCNKEIEKCIAIAKSSFNNMRNILINLNINIQTRIRTMEAYIWSILAYGCETWTISKDSRGKLEPMEMWLLRRMLRIPWTARITIQRVLELTSSKRSLLTTIRKRQLNFLGHVLRRHKYENLSLTGKIEDRRGRGRPRLKYIESLLEDVQGKHRPAEFLQLAEDRQRWRNITANVR